MKRKKNKCRNCARLKSEIKRIRESTDAAYQRGYESGYSNGQYIEKYGDR